MTLQHLSEFRIFCLFALLLLMGTTAMAQQVKMERFYLAETDLTAVTEPTIVYDMNNEKCALIKVETTQTGFNFEVGMLGIVKTEQHPGEIWLYVPHGVKRITISHPQLGLLRNQPLGMSVQEGRTYILKLTTDKVISTVYDDTRKKNIEFTLDPHNALFIINGMQESPDRQGVIRKNLSLGTYNIKVTAQGYHTLDTIIDLRQSHSASSQLLRLRQAFGYLTVPSSHMLDGADVYLDGELLGKAPIVNEPVMSGKHHVTIMQKLYKPFEEEFLMTDYHTQTFQPILKENFAYVTIKVPNEKAEIWVDNELLGHGEWHGRLSIDRHTVECRLASHISSTKKLTIASSQRLDVHCLPPKPVYGSLRLTTQPEGCRVTIDGHDMGQTPFLQSHILIGEKTVTVSKPGYQTQEFQVNITQDATVERQVTLNNICQVDINTTPSSALLYIDGNYEGSTPQTVSRPAGTYHLEVTKKGYKKIDENVLFRPGEHHLDYRLKRQMLSHNQFYADLGYQAMATPGLSVHAGGYIRNFNIELGYIKKFDPFEALYWLDNSSSSYDTELYDQSAITLKLGYGIIIGTRFQITPQIGLNWVMISDDADSSSAPYDLPNVLTGVFGLRLHYALTPHIGLEITPEYSLPISKSSDFESLSKTSPDLEDQAMGFSIGTGLVFYFSAL